MLFKKMLRSFPALLFFGVFMMVTGVNGMGITASKVDTKKYFDDPQVADLAESLQAGNHKRVKALLDAGVDPNAVGKEGFRPIFFIFPASKMEAAAALLAAGADPNVQLTNKNTPLLFAVRMKNSAFTKMLLDAGADPNVSVENEKPVIHEAIYAKTPENIRLLAAAGADINKVWGGGTPLYGAIDALSFAAAAALLDLGADIHWRPSAGKVRDTAMESFCSLIPRIKPTRTNRAPIMALFDAFARRGISLSCVNEAVQFR